MISSANPYTGNTYNSWNNNHTIVGDTTIYNSLTKYFTDMLADRTNLNYFRVTTSGKYTMYLYPQAARTARGHRDVEGAQPDLVQDHRQGVRERAAVPSSGSPTGVGPRPGWTSPAGCGSCTTAAARSR